MNEENKQNNQKNELKSDTSRFVGDWTNDTNLIFSGIWDFSMFLYICAVILFILSPVFGSVASIQIHKSKEKGGFISLLITDIVLLGLIGVILV